MTQHQQTTSRSRAYKHRLEALEAFIVDKPNKKRLQGEEASMHLRVVCFHAWFAMQRFEKSDGLSEQLYQKTSLSSSTVKPCQMPCRRSAATWQLSC